MSEGDIQKAVDLYLDMGTTGVHTGTGASADRNATLFSDDDVRDAIPARFDRLIGDPEPPGFPGMSEWLSGAINFQPAEEVEESIEELTQSGNDPLYRPPDDLNTPGTYQEAMKKAKDSRKWLLVNIQASDEFGSMLLNRDIWSHETVKQIIQSAFVFFQRDRASSQGSTFASNHNITSFPVVCIVDPRTGRKVKQWAGDKFRGPLSATDMLSDFMGENPYGSSPVPSRASLTDTSSGVSSPRNSEVVQSITIPDTPGLPIAKKAKETPPLEMPTDLPTLGSPDEVRVAIRLSNGQKKQVSFRDSNSLHVIQQWVSSIEYLGPSKFQVRMSHPPKTLDISPSTLETISTAGVKGALLVVVLVATEDED